MPTHGLRESSQPDPIRLRPNDLAQTGSETTHELISGVAPAAPAIPVSAFARGDAELWSYIGANPSGANDANPNGAGMRLGCSPDDRRQSEPANARAEVLGAGRRQVVVGLRHPPTIAGEREQSKNTRKWLRAASFHFAD